MSTRDINVEEKIKEIERAAEALARRDAIRILDEYTPSKAQSIEYSKDLNRAIKQAIGDMQEIERMAKVRVSGPKVYNVLVNNTFMITGQAIELHALAIAFKDAARAIEYDMQRLKDMGDLEEHNVIRRYYDDAKSQIIDAIKDSDYYKQHKDVIDISLGEYEEPEEGEER